MALPQKRQTIRESLTIHVVLTVRSFNRALSLRMVRHTKNKLDTKTCPPARLLPYQRRIARRARGHHARVPLRLSEPALIKGRPEPTGLALARATSKTAGEVTRAQRRRACPPGSGQLRAASSKEVLQDFAAERGSEPLRLGSILLFSPAGLAPIAGSAGETPQTACAPLTSPLRSVRTSGGP